MKFILSNYNFDPNWVKKYTDDYIIYDRSSFPIFTKDIPKDKLIKVKNIGTDLYDKFTFIIDNYDNLPEVAVFAKSNLFKYMPKEEFDKVKDNKEFTPLLSKNHKVDGIKTFYSDDGMYNEKNESWIFQQFPPRSKQHVNELLNYIGFQNDEYFKFAPGSNYILTKENILKYPKDFYEHLRSYLTWAVYPGEAQILERNLYNIWK